MTTRWILLLALVACGAPSAPTTTPSTTTSPPSRPDYLSADGTRFATERVYEGECMPAGTRGGCHTLTLRPDGTARNFLFDAAMDGTYSIQGSTVTFVGTDPEMREELPLSADGKTLGSLTLKRVGPE